MAFRLPFSKKCMVSSKVTLGGMAFVAIAIAISIHRTHDWLLNSVPYEYGVTLANWFHLALYVYFIGLCIAFYKFAICKADRIFFTLLTALFFTGLLRELAIFPAIRNAMLSMNQDHPQILYGLGISRWLLGVALYLVVLVHWMTPSKEVHP